MFSTSSDYKTQIRESGHAYSARMEIHFADTTVLEIGNEYFMAPDYLTIKKGVSRPGYFDLGIASMATLSATLNNYNGYFDSYDFTDAVLYVDVGLKLTDNTIEWVDCGKFTIDSPVTKTTTLKITAIDDMYKFEQPYANSTLVYPATLSEILDDCATDCGVTWNVVAFTNSTIEVQNKPAKDGLTYRDVVSMVAQLACKFAYVDYAGLLKLGWYDIDASGYAIDRLKTFSVAQADFTIDGIEYLPEDNSVAPTYVGSETGVIIVLEGNLLIDDNNITSLLSNLATDLVGFTFRPFFASQIFTDFSIDPGDAVVVTSPTDVDYLSTVSNVTHKLYGGSSYSADAESIVVNRVSASNPISRLRAIAATQADNKVTAYEEMTLEATKALAEAQGYYETRITGSDGRILEYYQHDQVLLSNSQRIVKITLDGIGYSTDGGINYTTVILSNGNATIPQLASRLIVADLIRTGKVQSLDGTTYFDLTNAEIKEVTTIGDNTYEIVINATDGFAIYKNDVKILGIDSGTGNITTTGDIIADDITSGTLQSVSGVIVIDLDNEIFRIGDHTISVSSGKLVFSSAQTSNATDIEFKKASGSPVKIQVTGDMTTTGAFTWGSKLRAEVRSDSGNAGVDFVF